MGPVEAMLMGLDRTYEALERPPLDAEEKVQAEIHDDAAERRDDERDD